MTHPQLDELVALARRDRPAPGTLQAIARGLRVPFVTLPIATVTASSTAIASVLTKAGISRLALLGWGTGSVVVVSGVVAAVALQQPASAPIAAPPPPSIERAVETPVPAAEPALVPEEAVAPPPSAERRVARDVGPPPAEWGEPQLIERARKALSADPRRALALAQEHQRRFPGGALGVERDVIAIEALARTGQLAEARRRALAFEKRYPNSIHAPQMRALLARLEGK